MISSEKKSNIFNDHGYSRRCKRLKQTPLKFAFQQEQSEIARQLIRAEYGLPELTVDEALIDAETDFFYCVREAMYNPSSEINLQQELNNYLTLLNDSFAVQRCFAQTSEDTPQLLNTNPML